MLVLLAVLATVPLGALIFGTREPARSSALAYSGDGGSTPAARAPGLETPGARAPHALVPAQVPAETAGTTAAARSGARDEDVGPAPSTALVGRVETEAGAPVAGALVVLIEGGGGPEERFLDELPAARTAAARTPPFDVTGADGGFRLSAAGARAHPCLAIWPGDARLPHAVRRPLEARELSTGVALVVRLAPAAPVTLRFADARARPVAGALAIDDGRLGFDLLDESPLERVPGAERWSAERAAGAVTLSLPVGGFKLLYTPARPAAARKKAFFLARRDLSRAEHAFRLE